MTKQLTQKDQVAIFVRYQPMNAATALNYPLREAPGPYVFVKSRLMRTVLKLAIR